MWNKYYTVSSIKEAIDILESENKHAKIVAGGTDLILEMKKNAHPDVRSLIDITRIKDEDFIREEGDYIHLGPLVTHNQCLVSDLLIKYAIPLVKAAQSIGAAQIRNIGTVYGNLITASPANDTISPLTALNADLLVKSAYEEKWVNIHDFYLDVRKTILKTNEMVLDLRFKKMVDNQKGTFVKKLLREVHGISVANSAIIMGFEGSRVIYASIALGAVGPKIIRAKIAEDFLLGKELNLDVISQTAELANKESSPITDVRGSDEYRVHLVKILVENELSEIWNNTWNDFRSDPVLLWGKNGKKYNCIDHQTVHDHSTVIKTKINNKKYELLKGQNHTLVKLIRDEAKLIGTKLGCEEGECGSCTVFLDNLPVLSCLIPAPRAHDAEITTIEGIAKNGRLHPVQQAFIDEGAVQCGYCTPGFIMSAVKLLEEKSNPSKTEIMEGLAGNICRCTGYYSIISAVEKASKNSGFEK